MNIIWKGQFCFQISASQNKNNSVLIATDPFSKEETGLRTPRLQADILLLSVGFSSNAKKSVLGEPFIIEGPGEYEINKIYIEGIGYFPEESFSKDKKEAVIYIIEAEGLRVCYLGGFKQKELSSEQIERIGDIDVLIMPIGGHSTVNGKEAIKIMSQIEPKITIPMHYKIPGLKIKLDGLDVFLKALGIKPLKPLPKLSIKKKDISEEEAKIVVLEP